jgi:hypothetical protein
LQNIKTSVKGINLVASTQIESTIGELAMSIATAAKKGP